MKRRRLASGRRVAFTDAAAALGAYTVGAIV
jgi:hypothetical protein